MSQEFLAHTCTGDLYDHLMDLGEWVRAARKHRGLTQQELGDALHVSKSNVSAWEHGRHEPSYGQLRQIAKLTGYPLEESSTARQASGSPIPPPRDFSDRHWLSDSDWATFQAVRMMLSEPELQRIREQAERAERIAAERLASIVPGKPNKP